MNIGKPKRVYRVEPIREPLPSKRRPEEAPKEPRRERITAPSR